MSGAVIWLTGLSGSGKSTIAKILEDKLTKIGHKVELLDGDIIRKNIGQGLGFSEEDITTNNKRIIFLSKIIERLSGIAIVPVIAPFKEVRNFAKSEIKNYFEVFVDCPLEVCIKRDVKGLYSKVKRGEIKDMIGVHTRYDIPSNPNIVVNTTEMSAEECANIILKKLAENDLIQIN